MSVALRVLLHVGVMALVLLSGGSGEEVVAERLAPAAQVPYQTACTMRP